MAINAINSINFNRVAFKGAQPAKKSETVNQPQSEENFFKDNKETILTLAGIGAAVLGAAMLVKSGKSGKAAAELPITDRNYTGVVGERAINKIKNAAQTAKINEQIAEFGPDGTRHLERMKNPVYTDEKVGYQVFGQPVISGSDSATRGWIRANEAKLQGKQIDPSDFIDYAKIEGLELSSFVK